MGIVVAELPWLADQAREIQDLENSLQRKTHEVRKRQGEILLEVKEKLGHGNFIKWLKGLGWSDRTARNYIQEFKQSSSPKLSAGKPEMELIEAEVVEIYDQPMISAAKEDAVKSASLAVLDEARSALDEVKAELDYFRSDEGFNSLLDEVFPIIEAIAEAEDFEQDEEILRELYILPEEERETTKDGKTTFDLEIPGTRKVQYRRVEVSLLHSLVKTALIYEAIDKHVAALIFEIEFKDIDKRIEEIKAEFWGERYKKMGVQV